MAAVVTPGGRIGDNSSLNRSPRVNNVERKGGLPEYVRIVANALMRKRGFSRSHAIATARNAMKKWLAKSKNPAVKAAAAGATASLRTRNLSLTAGELAQVLELALSPDVDAVNLAWAPSTVLDLAVASVKDARGVVKGHYPADTLGWMRKASWTRESVPLSKVDDKPRPAAPHNPAKVAAIRAKIRDGVDLKPVLLVRHPGPRVDSIADGYHRTAALRAEGRTHVTAYVAHGTARTGPWDHEMHARKQNLALTADDVLDLADRHDVSAIELAGRVNLANDYQGGAAATSSSSSSSGRTWDESKHPRQGGKFAPKGTASAGADTTALTPEQEAQIRKYQAEHGLPETGKMDALTVEYARGGAQRREDEKNAKKGGGGGGGGGGDKAAEKAAADAKKAEADKVKAAQKAAADAVKAADKKKAEAEKAQRDMVAAREREDKAAAAAASRAAAEAKAEEAALRANAARLEQQTAAAQQIASQRVWSSPIAGVPLPTGPVMGPAPKGSIGVGKVSAVRSGGAAVRGTRKV